ncbi:MAG: FISUMP domain-containing protein [Dysgonomonas sp.]|nr:FISUMP domain-containing protein [Dysgonomonas sp.]
MTIKTNLHRHTALFLFIMLCSVQLHAQTTIGSDLDVSPGSLIDIKKYKPDVNNATAKGGLGMPRVILDTITPDNPSRFAHSIGGSGSWPLASHTGLTVYNLQPTGCIDSDTHKWYTPETNPELIEHVIYKGLYTWNGTQWQYIGNQDKLAPEVKLFTDNRPGDTPQTYKYRKFGEAGYWMLENMRATVLPKGQMGLRLGADNPPGNNIIDDILAFVRYAYAHPEWDPRITGDGRDLTNPYYSNMDPEMGYFYSWAAAAYGNTVRTDQGYTDQTPTQGICPDGWYLPSDKDWSILEKHMYENAHLYSTHTEAEVVAWNSSKPWLDAWNNHIFNSSNNWSMVFRPAGVTSGTATAMTSPCLVPYTNADNAALRPQLNNKSLPSFKGGFSVKPNGRIVTRAVPPQKFSGSYGFLANFWTSSFFGSGPNGNIVAYHRQLVFAQPYPVNPSPQGGVGRGVSRMLDLSPVRCKTDVDPNP